MIIQVGDQFLDFDEDLEVERKIKLFDDISSTQGDISFQFTIPPTNHNKKTLNITTLNDSPFSRIDCTILNDSGIKLYIGFLRIESAQGIDCSFYSGNSDWIEQLNVDLDTFNYNSLNRFTTEAQISGSWTRSSGIVWPLVERGALAERKTIGVIYEEDFQPFVYVKDIVRLFLSQSGIKITGDILKDSIYNNLVTTNNGQHGVRDFIDAKKIYAGKSSVQSITSTTLATVTFTNVLGQYFNSPDNNWDAVQSTYVSDDQYKKINVDIYLKTAAFSFIAHKVILQLQVDGVSVWDKVVSHGTNQNENVIQETIELSSIIGNGSVIKLLARKSTSVFFGNNYNILTDSYIKVTPIKFYTVFAVQLLPQLKASEFLGQLLSFLGMLSDYNANTKTIRTRLFERITDQEEQDLSEYVSEIIDINTSDFINDYAKNNNLLWDDPGDEDTDNYNEKNYPGYGNGVLEVDNDFLEDDGDLIELDFVSSFQKNIPSMEFTLPSLGMCEYNETDESRDITSVTDNGDGYARFNWSSGGAVGAYVLVRISDSTVTEYDGVWMVLVNNSSYAILDTVVYNGTATATLEVLEIIDVDNENQHLLLNVPNMALSNYSGLTSLSWENGNSYTTVGFAYFWLPFLIGKGINKIQDALYFDPVNDVTYQQGLKETRFRKYQSVLNSPYKVVVEMYIPEKVLTNIDFLRPVRLKTEKFNELFFINKITGHIPCEMELIKL